MLCISPLRDTLPLHAVVQSGCLHIAMQTCMAGKEPCQSCDSMRLQNCAGHLKPLDCVQIARVEFEPTTPSLIVVPNNSLAYWKGELEYWLTNDTEIIYYTGPPGARQQIAQNEFWLPPGALDGKVSDEKDKLTERVPKPHIVLISMESLHQVRNATFVLQHTSRLHPCTAVGPRSKTLQHSRSLLHMVRAGH